MFFFKLGKPHKNLIFKLKNQPKKYSSLLHQLTTAHLKYKFDDVPTNASRQHGIIIRMINATGF